MNPLDRVLAAAQLLGIAFGLLLVACAGWHLATEGSPDVRRRAWKCAAAGAILTLIAVLS